MNPYERGWCNVALRITLIAGFYLAGAGCMFGQARPPAAVVELGANLPVRPVAAGDLLVVLEG